MDLRVCYLPHQWRALTEAERRASACVVIDQIRATSTGAMALANGAAGVQPVASVAEAEHLKAQHPEALLAGERGGQPLPGFDLGNSPREMTPERVKGRLLIQTTTNGTQALAACRDGRAVLTASFLNLDAVAARLRELGPPWIILCAGFEGDFGFDDAVTAGALAEAMGVPCVWTSLYRSLGNQAEMVEALRGCLAGRELAKVGMLEDAAFCAQRDLLSVVPTLDPGGVLRV
jgi:2-phosphosulfolactate phosphatase